MKHSGSFRVSWIFAGIALVCLWFADIEVSTLDPWGELGRMAHGAVTPNFLAVDALGQALAQTVAFALLGVAGGALAGFGLALGYQHRTVRWFCAFIRSIHEIFWALIFLQGFGLHPLTGLLAIGVPYAGIFAKIFAEILEESDPTPLKALPHGTGHLSAFFYAKLPDAWRTMVIYTGYRLECGLRSSAVLGFVGLPTLGFHLETFFRQGQYSEAAALLLLFYGIIASLRLWARPRLLPLYLLASLWLMSGSGHSIYWPNVWRFLGEDIVPAPLRGGLGQPGQWADLQDWLWLLLGKQAWPGFISTLVLTQVALVGTGLVTLVTFPWISARFVGPIGRRVGHGVLVVMRSTPEYILAYVFLQLLGPSMLPAILALSLHNGAIIGHLTGRHADTFPLRVDAPRGLNLYGYEILPRVYGQFLAFLFYRWEIIFRETAILGILGIRTLGFHVDSAMAELRLDRAMLLILITALLTIGIDGISRSLRSRLRLSRRIEAA